MGNDPYAPCVCGSGKKLKFCCLDILSDMQRVEKLRENQPDAAVKLLRSLYESHPDREVLVTELAGFLADSGQAREARDLCVEFLKRHPDEPRVLLIVADLYLDDQGFAASRRIAHRALQLATPAEFMRVAMVLTKIGMLAFRNRNYASSFAHLHRAFEYAPPHLERHIEMLLGAWTMGNENTCPWMGPLDLLDVNVTGELREMDHKARRLHKLGCWEPCSILYSRMIRQDQDNGPLWYNLGLFQLWDDRPQEAAQSLQKAACLIDDPDAAAEAEALGWLLELETGPDQVKVVRSSCDLASASAVIDRLSSDDRFSAVDRGHGREGEDDLWEFNLRDPNSSEPDGAMKILGNIVVAPTGDEPNEAPHILIYTNEGVTDRVWDIVRDAVGDGIAADAAPTEPKVTASTPALLSFLDWKIQLPTDVTGAAHRQMVEQRVQRCVDEWLTTPLDRLDGRTLREAATDPGYRVRVAAAVLLLQIGCQREGHELDVNRVRDELNIPHPAPLPIDKNRAIETVPYLHVFRLPLGELTDEQIVDMAERSASTWGMTLTDRVTEELLRRPEAVEMFSPRRAHLLRATVARYFGRTELLTESFDAARETTPPQADAFQYRLELDLRELTYRLDDPEDRQLPHLLDSLRSRYFRKIPEIAELVRGELERRGCDRLLSHIEEAVSAGIVLPSDEPKPAGKLWLPGQD